MKLHEHQAKTVLAGYGVSVPKQALAMDPESAKQAFLGLKSPYCMVKVQVLMGGRGKAGGIRKAKSADEAKDIAQSLLGKPFSTPQSAGESKIVRSVLITEGTEIKEEY